MDRRVQRRIPGEAPACSVKSFPHTETSSGTSDARLALSIPSYGTRRAWTTSGRTSATIESSCLAAPGRVQGPSQCRSRPRAPIAPRSAGRRARRGRSACPAERNRHPVQAGQAGDGRAGERRDQVDLVTRLHEVGDPASGDRAAAVGDEQQAHVRPAPLSERKARTKASAIASILNRSRARRKDSSPILRNRCGSANAWRSTAASSAGSSRSRIQPLAGVTRSAWVPSPRPETSGSPELIACCSARPPVPGRTNRSASR